MIGESLRDQSRTWIGDTKNIKSWRKSMMPRNVDPLLYNCPFLSHFFDFSSTAFEISLFRCSLVRRLTLAALDSSFKIEELLHKMAISFSESKVEQHNHSFLARWHDLPISSDPLLWFLSILSVHICLSFSVPLFPLRPLVGLRPPWKIALFSHSVSHSFSFILTFCLTVPAVSLPAAVQNTTTKGVLSKCWCHERSEQSRSSQGIWYGAGATKSWFLVLQLLYSRPLSFWLLFLARWGWGWVHIGSLESMLRATIVSDGTWSIHHQAS